MKRDEYLASAFCWLIVHFQPFCPFVSFFAYILTAALPNSPLKVNTRLIFQCIFSGSCWRLLFEHFLEVFGEFSYPVRSIFQRSLKKRYGKVVILGQKGVFLTIYLDRCLKRVEKYPDFNQGVPSRVKYGVSKRGQKLAFLVWGRIWTVRSRI